MTDTDARVAPEEVLRSDLGPLRLFAQSLLTKYRVPTGWLQADDVVQYAVAELLGRQCTVQNPEAYLRTVARRFVLRAVREGRRFTVPPADGPAVDQVAGSRTRPVSVQPARPVEDQAETRIAAERVYRELAGLPSQQSRAVYLVQALGMSRAEAAAMMDIAEGTVSSHLSRGLTKLREALGYVLGSFLLVAAVIIAVFRGAPNDIASAGWPRVISSVAAATAPWRTPVFVAVSVALVAFAAWATLRRRGGRILAGPRRPAAGSRRPAARPGDPVLAPSPLPGSADLFGRPSPLPSDTMEIPVEPGRRVGEAAAESERRRAERLEQQRQRARQSAVRRYE